MRRLGDPFVGSVVAVGVLGAAAFLVMMLGWRGVAAEVSVATQLAYVVSGGIGGVALVGFSSGLLVIQGRRWTEAQRRAEFEGVLRVANDLLASARHDLDRGPS